uniref:Uncharacterized protein n=1 Tax=Anguilla anguilla TaxID=7936 RepID=A0A0E9T6F4_ANGAN
MRGAERLAVPVRDGRGCGGALPVFMSRELHAPKTQWGLSLYPPSPT